jgi:hypothetical protein
MNQLQRRKRFFEMGAKKIGYLLFLRKTYYLCARKKKQQ